MKVGIIGCGLIGRKRASALDKDDILVAACDTNKEVAEAFASTFDCPVFTDPSALISKTDCEIIIVAVVNKFILGITEEALKLGKHVLAEKPLGRNASESKRMVDAALLNNRILKTGFNHRFHPALSKAKAMFDDGQIGKLLFIRGRYGHGGRPGMEKEWRASKDLCGGGELLDQGVHLIDLSRWFAGDIRTAFGKVRTKFWDMEVEDNAFILLESIDKVDIQLQVSWTNWKNIFSMEIFGSDGYLKIEGLGGSYGPETLEFGKRRTEGGRPDIELFEFPPEDISWNKEWNEFKQAIRNGCEPIGNGMDGHRANEIIEALYASSERGTIIELVT
ncbi:MAG: Gfo/Idh/MocA family oxidoreductase [Bacteroidales bacterium]|nr:Gfo/Idh/MocA family oxidoreductase [Bacteroidales bacterium]